MNTGISFIIPCYNCENTIDESINSIISDNLGENDEIILVDDGSTDNSINKLLHWKNAHPGISVYRHNINKGTAAAGRNTGIDKASNDLIFCLDADNVLYPGTVFPLKDFLLKNKLDAAAFGTIDYFIKTTTNITNQWVLSKELDFIEALNYPMKTPCGSGNYLFTKDIWKKAGRYNESIGGAYDSEAFGLKILAEGAKFHTLEGLSYLHRQGYESTFIREYQNFNPSLLFLSVLFNYMHLIDHNQVEYMFGKGRLIWKDNTQEYPIRPRSHRPVGPLNKFLGKLTFNR